MVAAARAVLRQRQAQARAVEPLGRERLERGGDGRRERAGDPGPQRDVEAALLALEHLRGEPAAQRLAQRVLAAAAAHLLARGQRDEALDEAVVEQRWPELERGPHRGAVGLDQDPVGQEGLEVGVGRAQERVVGARPAVVRLEGLEGIVPGQRAGQIGREQRQRIRARELRQAGVVGARGIVAELLERALRAQAARGPVELGIDATERPQRAAARAAENPPRAVLGQVEDVAPVAAEDLVAAVARERHGHVLAGHARDEQRGHARGIGERLVEEPGQRVERQLRVGLQTCRVVHGVQARRGALGDRQLVEGLLAEAHRAEHERVGAAAGHGVGDRARVDAAGEEAAERHVADELLAHRGVERLEDLRAARRSAQLVAGELPVALDAQRAVLQDQHARGRQALHALPGGLGPADPALDEVVEQRARAQAPRQFPAGEQRLGLAPEPQPPGRARVVERLDADPVAREQQARVRGCAPVEHGDREHAHQALGEARAALLVEVRDALGVRARAEDVAAALELAAQLAVVVDLAVAEHGHVAGLVPERLGAARGVDHRQAPEAHAEGRAQEVALVIRAAVGQRAGHVRELRLGR